MASDDAEFDLRDLNDQELTEQVHDDLYNGLKSRGRSRRRTSSSSAAGTPRGC